MGKISADQDSAVDILSGATRILQLLFLALNLSACWGCLILQGRAAKWNDATQLFLGFLCVGISAALSLPFAMMLDTISDAILYCKSVEAEIARRRRSEVKNAPLPCVGS